MTYLAIDESADPDLVEKKLNRLIAMRKGQKNTGDKIMEKAVLEPLANIHLKSDSYVYADLIINKGSIQEAVD